MTDWLIAWLETYRGAGWFRMGVRGPVPVTWQGGAATGLLVATFAIDAILPLRVGGPVVTATLAAFAATVYWTLGPEL